jgi:hypothetical protein
LTALLFKGEFEHSREAAVLAVAAAREKRAGKGAVSDAWDIEDHLTALKARIVPLRSIGTELLSAAIHVHGALWPSIRATLSVSELASALRCAGRRIHAWKRSGARAGADQVLTQVLSWYEGLDLDAIQRLRMASLWCSDPAKIQRRQEVAHRIASWSSIRAFTASVIPSDSESDYEDDEETDATGDANDEIPKEDDAASGAVTETAAPRDVATSPTPEASQAEVRPDAPSTAAGTEAEAAPAASPETAAPAAATGTAAPADATGTTAPADATGTAAPADAAPGVAPSADASAEKPTSPIT